MDVNDLHRDFGKMEGRMDSLENQITMTASKEDIRNLRKDIDNVGDLMRDVRADLSEIKTARAVNKGQMAILLSVASILGGAVWHFLQKKLF